MIVHLRMSSCNRGLMQDRYPDEFSLVGRSGDTWLSFEDGRDGITLGYIRSLAIEGYVGLQQIPRGAVKRGA